MLWSMHALRSIFRSPAFEFCPDADFIRGSDMAVLALACCATVAAVAALPTNKEVAYGLIADRNFKAARAHLVDIHARGNGDLHSAVALHEVHLRFGELDQADTVIQSALKAHPDSVELLERASRFYQHAQEPAKHLQMLVRILNIKPNSEVLGEALQMLRLRRNYEGEKAVLIGLSNSSILSAAHHTRLGQIFAREKRYDQAAIHFIRADTLSSQPDWRSRIALFRVLLLQRKYTELEVFAKRWLADKTPPDQLAFLYHEAISNRRTRLAQIVLKNAIIRGHISRDDAARLARGSDE